MIRSDFLCDFLSQIGCQKLPLSCQQKIFLNRFSKIAKILQSQNFKGQFVFKSIMLRMHILHIFFRESDRRTFFWTFFLSKIEKPKLLLGKNMRFLTLLRNGIQNILIVSIIYYDEKFVISFFL